MEENDQKNNVDGIRPPEPQSPVSNVDGFVTNPRPDTTPSQSNSPYTSRFDNQPADASEESAGVTTAETTPRADDHAIENAKLKEQKKGLSIWLVVLLIILFAGAAAAGVFFWQSAQNKKDLDAEKAKTSQATQAQVDTLTKANADLTAQVASLQKTVDSQQAYIDSLTKAMGMLKTACGKSCEAIPTPTPTPTPSKTTTTPTPSATVTPTPTPTPTKTN